MTSSRSRLAAATRCPSELDPFDPDAPFDERALTEGLFDFDDMLDDEPIMDDDPLSDAAIFLPFRSDGPDGG